MSRLAPAATAQGCGLLAPATETQRLKHATHTTTTKCLYATHAPLYGSASRNDAPRACHAEKGPSAPPTIVGLDPRVGCVRRLPSPDVSGTRADTPLADVWLLRSVLKSQWNAGRMPVSSVPANGDSAKFRGGDATVKVVDPPGDMAGTATAGTKDDVSTPEGARAATLKEYGMYGGVGMRAETGDPGATPPGTTLEKVAAAASKTGPIGLRMPNWTEN